MTTAVLSLQPAKLRAVLRGLGMMAMRRAAMFAAICAAMAMGGGSLTACNPANPATGGQETETAGAPSSLAPSDTAAAARGGLASFEADTVLAEIDALELADLGYDDRPPRLSPKAEQWHGVGLRALRDRDPDRAVDAFAIVLDEAPDSAEASLNLARALAAQGQEDRAARAVAHALVREYPHAWRDYTEAEDLATLRASSHHARLRVLRDRLAKLHAQARDRGVAETVTWSPAADRRGAQAGVRVDGRFIPVAPRVWSTTAVSGGTPWADAVFDAQAGVVLQVVARGGAARRHTALRLLSALDGETLGQRDFGADAETLDVRLLGGHVEVRLPDAAWTDLRGRAVHSDEGAAASRIRLDSTGLRRL